MEPLLKSLRELPRRFKELSPTVRWALVGGALLVALVVFVTASMSAGSTYQYAFTNLTTEDSTEAASALKAAGIPFRQEANGSALAVPASKVHDARLLLAAAGLPRGGGVGFELFDRGDFGTSEFTQKVNLRRATEGELARTISRLSSVRNARVHLTLSEKGLYRDDDKRATAAVVLTLQPGRVMQERELAGVRHLVSSAVPGLDPDSVTIVDQRGTVLSGDRSASARVASQQREIEGQLEQRIVELLEPAVGQGAIVAKVTATLDTTEVETTADVYDADNPAVRSERKTVELVNGNDTAGGGVAGAAANVPIGAAAPGGGGARGVQTSREDETKNYEIGKKVTHTISRAPRLTRLSAAVLVDGVDGKPRSEAEMRRLADLAKHALGFDVNRGDQFDISSAPFAKSDKGTDVPAWLRPEVQQTAKLGGIALLVLGAIAFVLIKTRGKKASSKEIALIKPGASVAEVEASLGVEMGALPPAAVAALTAKGALPAASPQLMQERARELGKADPARAANLLKAWIAADTDSREATRSG